MTSPITTNSILKLGTEDDSQSMIEAFRREGLGRILDVVPNHMGVWGADNPLWLDVLEWGPYSQYAGWFDIDWSAQQGKLLAPVLGAAIWRELEVWETCSLRFESRRSSPSRLITHRFHLSAILSPEFLV